MSPHALQTSYRSSEHGRAVSPSSNKRSGSPISHGSHGLQRLVLKNTTLKFDPDWIQTVEEVEMADDSKAEEGGNPLATTVITG
jgi:hypothetical protein